MGKINEYEKYWVIHIGSKFVNVNKEFLINISIVFVYKDKSLVKKTNVHQFGYFYK